MLGQVTKQVPLRSPGHDEEEGNKSILLIILPNGFNSCGVTDGVTSLEYNETHSAEPRHGTINKVSSILQNKICHFSIFDLVWTQLGVAVALQTHR